MQKIIETTPDGQTVEVWVPANGAEFTQEEIDFINAEEEREYQEICQEMHEREVEACGGIEGWKRHQEMRAEFEAEQQWEREEREREERETLNNAYNCCPELYADPNDYD